MADRLQLAQAMVNYFERYPEHQVEFADVTAANGRELCEEMIVAQNNVCASRRNAAEKKKQRDAAERKLRSEMRLAINLLHHRLKGNDPRWNAFGLNQPKPDLKPTPQPLAPPAAEPTALQAEPPTSANLRCAYGWSAGSSALIVGTGFPSEFSIVMPVVAFCTVTGTGCDGVLITLTFCEGGTFAGGAAYDAVINVDMSAAVVAMSERFFMFPFLPVVASGAWKWSSSRLQKPPVRSQA